LASSVSATLASSASPARAPSATLLRRAEEAAGLQAGAVQPGVASPLLPAHDAADPPVLIEDISGCESDEDDIGLDVGTAGRTKARHWADDDRIDVSDEELTPTSRTPYLDAVHRGPPPTRAAKALLHPRPPPSGAGGAASGRRAASRRGGRRRRLWPQLVHGIPIRPVEGRVPAHQRLARCRRVSAPDSDGWREILHRQETCPRSTSVVPSEPMRGSQPASL
jgi:hypothetical protein